MYLILCYYFNSLIRFHSLSYRLGWLTTSMSTTDIIIYVKLVDLKLT